MNRAAARSSAGGKGKPPAKAPARKRFLAKSLSGGYWLTSATPLYSLVFILPMLVLFEWCATWQMGKPVAFRMLMVLLDNLGAGGPLIPAYVLVGILLFLHVHRHDPWKIDLPVLPGMGLESFLLAAPLLGLAITATHPHIHLPTISSMIDGRYFIILSVGAGIYEEMVFRLILIGLLTIFFETVLKVPKKRATVFIVAASAVSFALYHYLGAERFQWRSFIFRSLAGAYFAILFVTRGFGITAGTHATYDILISILGHVFG